MSELLKPRQVTPGQVKELGLSQSEVESWKRKQEGEANYECLDRWDRSFRVISGEHFSKKAGDFLKQRVEPEIQDPSEWLFLIEGTGTGVDADEVKIAEQIARKGGIPIEDPIFNAFQADVAQIFLNSERGQKIPRYVVIKEVVSELVHDLGVIRPSILFDSFGLRRGELSTSMSRAATEMKRSPERYAAYAKSFREGAKEVSNAISAQVLAYYLRKHLDHRNVVLCIGEDHRPVLDTDISNLPDSLNLSNEQMTRIIEAEKQRRKKRIEKGRESEK